VKTAYLLAFGQHDLVEGIQNAARRGRRTVDYQGRRGG